MLRYSVWLMVMLLLTGCSSWSEKAADNRRASEVYVRKGVGYMEEGRYEQALSDFDRALELNSSNSEAHNAIAVLYERLDKLDEVRSHYRQAVSLDPHNYGALNNYSRFLCSHEQLDEGLELLNRILDSKLYDQPWMALANQGVCYKMAGKLEEAAQSLRTALESQPTFAPALLEMARLSFINKDHMKTRAFVQRYAGSAQHTAESLWIAAQTEAVLGNQAAMRTYLDQLRSRFPNSPEAAESKKADNHDAPHTP